MTISLLPLPAVNLSEISIKEKHSEQGITTELLTKMWASINNSLVLGEYGNLWVRLHSNADFKAVYREKDFKALKYLFPLLMETAKKQKASYVVIESDSSTKVPEYARQAGMKARYMNSESGSQVHAIRVKDGSDNWPKFRAIKESISAVPLIKDERTVYVVIGKNKPNGALGAGRPIGTITGYREPGESFEQAVIRELGEETGLKLPESIKPRLIAQTFKRDYYPGADDRNEVALIPIGLGSGFTVQKKEDRTWTLIQPKSGDGTVGQEIKASDDLEEVYVLPVGEALDQMDLKSPGSSGRAKVDAAYKAFLSGLQLVEKEVSFGWKSALQSYNDVKFTSPGKDEDLEYLT